MPKRRRVPHVLWRLFRDRARPLADAIVRLLPPPPPAAAEAAAGAERCRWCGGRRCLGCVRGGGGAAVASFLLRPDDPSEYRRLLTRCFVVVGDDAPPLSDSSPLARWSQRQIVLRTIEMVCSESSAPGNVIANGFSKDNHSSVAVELLTSSAWCLLLERVGDSVMMYLLKCASIFLPYPCKKHFQVAGLPITKLDNMLSKHSLESHSQRAQKKRKRAGYFKLFSQMEKSTNLLHHETSLISSSHGADYGKKNEELQMIVPEAATSTSIIRAASSDESFCEVLQGSSNLIVSKVRKHRRPFSWQRRGKKRRIDSHGSGVVCSEGESSSAFNHPYIKMPVLCSCCQLLVAVKKLAKGTQISRKDIFYDLESTLSAGFPRKHILNTLKPSVAGSLILLQKLFGLSNIDLDTKSNTCLHDSSFCPGGSTCLFPRYHSMSNLLKTLIRKTQCCQYSRLLDKHCPPLTSVRDASGNAHSISEGFEFVDKLPRYNLKHHENKLETNVTEFEELKSYCSKSQVVAFIWAVCRSIVPLELLGAPINWRKLRRNIYKFIELRRFEQFSLKQCMHKLQAVRFMFLFKDLSIRSNGQVPQYAVGENIDIYRNGNNELNEMMSILRHTLLERWIYWFFSFLVVPLVRANFYVTESEHGKQEIFYFRKSIWESLSNRVMSRLKDKSYTCLSDASVRSILGRRSFGFSKLRFRPKENGLRMLANLKASSCIPSRKSHYNDQCCQTLKTRQFQEKAVKCKHFRSANSVLRDMHAVLKSLKVEESEKLGSSVFDYNDVYRKLCPFLVGMKNGATELPDMFIVVSDVSKAFDSINHDKLLSILQDVITQPGYLLEESSEIVCRKKALWVHHNLNLVGEHIRSEPRRLAPCFFSSSLHGVLTNQERSRFVKREELFFNLIEHVKRNVLQFDKNFYLQGVGIPQGSIISSLLCSLYYGHLEQSVVFPFLEKAHEFATDGFSTRQSCQGVSGSNAVTMLEMDDLPNPSFLLLRFIDDILFISTSKRQAASFFLRLKRGFRDYNCFMNEEKFSLNFDVGPRSESRIRSHRVYIDESGNSFLRWSGLLINCTSLEVQADYTRYRKTHLRSALTVRWQGKPGSHLQTKLCDFLRPKCHPIFFDLNINSAAVVRLNVYQVFLLCAMKFHCYVCDLSYICKIKASSYVKMIETSFRHMFSLIKKRMRTVRLGPSLRPVLQLEEGEVEWLGLVAYIRTLERKQSRHKDLLSYLKSKFSRHGINRNVSPQLMYAVDGSHSSSLWKIEY
ncbi:telomerase reverse transcriptase isoform X3 [Syzygium oleosum]|uniref:telomerase reverse transcriptase isoform X3 n=1 Tax=Syzygium oleosum TaxID=219896 RepID=UPI0024BB163E|nr:telomerase reverse transcriptase isoform X3 [Syzygium oleosum]